MENFLTVLLLIPVIGVIVLPWLGMSLEYIYYLVVDSIKEKRLQLTEKRLLIERKENNQIEKYKKLCREIEKDKKEVERDKQEVREGKQKLLEDREAFELEKKQIREQIIEAAEREAEEIIDRAQTEAACQKEDAKQEAAKIIERAEADAREKVKNIFALNKKVGDKADPIRVALYEECRNQAERLLENTDSSRIRNATSTDLEVISVQIDLENSLSATIRSGSKTYETTLHGCKCPDFDKGRNLCKHMIFLAHAVGVFETIPEEAFEKALEEKGETK
ncbi:MAG: SWIM zinc finger family protein [Clostridia bacterium]|nr:SWIM zinc finger family protein [Clostridia bacterium]